jgi:hypothetical protein
MLNFAHISRSQRQRACDGSISSQRRWSEVDAAGAPWRQMECAGGEPAWRRAMRFSELRRLIGGISQKMPTTNLARARARRLRHPHRHPHHPAPGRLRIDQSRPRPPGSATGPGATAHASKRPAPASTRWRNPKPQQAGARPVSWTSGEEVHGHCKHLSLTPLSTVLLRSWLYQHLFDVQFVLSAAARRETPRRNSNRRNGRRIPSR